MPNLHSIQVSDGNQFTYELSLDFDDAALMDDAVSMTVTATKRAIEGGDDEEPLAQLEASLTFRPLEGVGEVTIEGQTYQFRLDSDLIPPSDEVAEDNDLEFLEDVLRPVGETTKRVGDAILDALELCPSPDPFVGCLLKGGITAAIGQSLECYTEARRRSEYEPEETEPEREWWNVFGRRGQNNPMVRRFFRCMRMNGLKMLGSAAKRAVRCIFSLGIF